jgi:hypothetical protein
VTLKAIAGEKSANCTNTNGFFHPSFPVFGKYLNGNPCGG